MISLFWKFLKETKESLEQDVAQLCIKFNKYQYQLDKKTMRRRFASTDRVNKFMVRKWVEKLG